MESPGEMTGGFCSALLCIKQKSHWKALYVSLWGALLRGPTARRLLVLFLQLPRRHWGLQKWDQWSLLDGLTSSVQLLIFVFSPQLVEVCPWRRYKSVSQLNAAQRCGNTKKADCQRVSIQVNKEQAYAPILPYKEMADLGNDCEVQFSSV